MTCIKIKVVNSEVMVTVTGIITLFKSLFRRIFVAKTGTDSLSIESTNIFEPFEVPG